MDYKKKYENALEWARQVINGECGFIRKEVEEVFPELKDSDDEKVRKAIVELVLQSSEILGSNNQSRMLAWLEKQVEYKTTWKPTIEQINALTHFIRSVGESGYASPYDNNTKLLYSLLHDLEQLEKQGEQILANSANTCKDAWSEEDEEQVSIITNIVQAHCGKLIDCRAILKWLKSLKERLSL